MPGGSVGGAQGFGRVYRAASLTIEDTETVIGFDGDSALAPLIQVTRSGGDIASFVAGVSVCTLLLPLAASAFAHHVTLRAYHVLPDDTPILIAKTHSDVPVSIDPTTLMCIAACGLDVDSRIRFTAQCAVGSRDVAVDGETGAWAYIVIG